MLDIIMFGSIARPSHIIKSILTMKDNIRLNATVTLVGVHSDQVSAQIAKLQNAASGKDKDAPKVEPHEVALQISQLTELKRLLDENPGIVEIVPDDGDTLPALYNAAIRDGENPWVMMVEAGIIFNPDWSNAVFHATQKFQNTKGFTGKLLVHGSGNIVCAGVSGPFTNPITYRGWGESHGTQRYTIHQPVGYMPKELMVIRRDIYQDLGGFDEGYRVAYFDMDLCHRILGGRTEMSGMFFMPELVMHTEFASLAQIRQAPSDSTLAKLVAADHQRLLDIRDGKDPDRGKGDSKSKEKAAAAR